MRLRIMAATVAAFIWINTTGCAAMVFGAVYAAKHNHMEQQRIEIEKERLQIEKERLEIERGRTPRA